MKTIPTADRPYWEAIRATIKDHATGAAAAPDSLIGGLRLERGQVHKMAAFLAFDA